MSPRKPDTMDAKTLVAKRLQEFFDGENFVEIAKKVSLTDRQIANSLRGDTKPSLKLLEYVAGNGGDVNYILTGTKAGGKKGKTPAFDGVFSEDQKLILERVQKLLNILLDIQYQCMSDSAVASKYASYLDGILKDAEGF